MRERAFFGWVFVFLAIYGLMAGITTQLWAGRMDAETVQRSGHVMAGVAWPLALPAYVGVVLVEVDDE